MTELAWSPCNKELKSVMDIVSKRLVKKGICYKNADTMITIMQTSKKILCGVQFEDNMENITFLPKNINFTIRFPGELRHIQNGSFLSNWQTDLLFPIFSLPGPRNQDNNEGAIPGN